MSSQLTLDPGRPRFAINETVYARASAIRGFLEPIRIVSISFDVTMKQYRYTFTYEVLKRSTNPQRVLPTPLFESEIIGICEAIDIQYGVLARELQEAEAKKAKYCQTGFIPKQSGEPSITDGNVIRPPTPLYRVGDIIYLRESPESTGKLESYRIDGVNWNNDIREWIYDIYISPRPEHNTSMGGRVTQRLTYKLQYPESQVCEFCTAIDLVIDFLTTAVNNNRRRRDQYCGSTE